MRENGESQRNRKGKTMNFRVRMKSAMLIVIMLCVLCVNSVLARVETGISETDHWYVMEHCEKFR